MTKPQIEPTLVELLETVLANVQDHWGCPIPAHLHDQVVKDLKLAIRKAKVS